MQTSRIIVERHTTPIPVPQSLVCSVCDRRASRIVYFTDLDARPFCSRACVRQHYAGYAVYERRPRLA